MKQSKSYYDCKNCDTRIQIHQGGTRSGKTYSICQALIGWCVENKNAGWVITIIRKTMPSLKASVMRDFFQILENEGWYSPANHNKSSSQYLLFGNMIEFVSIQESQRIRGRKRHIAFLNECNELTFEDFTQIILRTSEILIMDFNPSDVFSWIYDKVMTRKDASFYQTTYLDNPFLDINTIKEIEYLKLTDANYWRIYGLGERGLNIAAIFPHFNQVEQVPDRAQFISFGLDWGFTNDPSALISVYKDGLDLYVEEHLYETGLTNNDLSRKMRDLGIERQEIIADSAEPKSITELSRQGFLIKGASKGPDSIRLGIDVMKRHRINITKESINLIKEMQSYKWKTDRDGNQINEPEKGNDHAIDALRYVCLNKLMENYSGKYYVS
jgi:phage terminase large subunit